MPERVCRDQTLSVYGYTDAWPKCQQEILGIMEGARWAIARLKAHSSDLVQVGRDAFRSMQCRPRERNLVTIRHSYRAITGVWGNGPRCCLYHRGALLPVLG
jgi:hypothetical protein